ncbi:uncharacterized protein LOC132445431 isoform X1 [Gadus macrocephalus]|uniref:uncharacterized protein LOC132445431 isoform X1 n=2 Tax=Gadus macrocephalus TaxID=80720 RepID=UPI0028CB2962|nr:uncharacterized protein LOC132445431 isoform X1 [Gadus macrocephalus]XP_059891393.1 uncharacterized protein LOC132445431 isoform X1 [Gadus macrocephalus]
MSGTQLNLLWVVAQQLMPGTWTEETGLDIEGVPQQLYGIDCGVFMVMYSWYITMDAHFDFNVLDMPHLRRWWCKLLLDNYGIEGCGKRFCHFTQEGHQMVNGLLAPVFRVTRKRKVLTKADDVFLKDTIEAAAWCQLQTFTDHVSLPMVIGVEGAEQQALLAELKSVDRSCPEESLNRIEPFQFFFNSKKDYEMFCVEMFDRRKLKVFAYWE